MDAITFAARRLVQEFGFLISDTPAASLLGFGMASVDAAGGVLLIAAAALFL